MSNKQLKIIFGIALIVAVSTTVTAVHYSQRCTNLQEEVETRETRIKGLEEALSVKPKVIEQTEVLPALKADREEADRLRAELEALRQQLAAQEQEKPQVQEARAEPEETREDRDARRQEERKNFMERLKESDPERYEQIRNFREQATRTVVENVSDQFTFFSDLDLSGLTQEQIASHQQLLERLSRLSELVGSAGQDSEDPRAMGRAIFGEFHEIRPLLENEREILLYDAALSAGYEDEGAKEFVDYLDYVNEMTSPRGMMRGVFEMGGMGGFGRRGSGRGGSDRGGSSE